MKRRFILTIALVMAVAIGAVSVLQALLFRTEQYRQIDNRIEATASLLISSDLPEADLHEFEEAEDIILEAIGGERFNQFIVIHGRDGRELYRSRKATMLPAGIPMDKKWQTIENEGHLIRVLTIPLSGFYRSNQKDGIRNQRVLQTGLVLDEDLLRWKEISRQIVIFSLLTVVFILLATLSLAEALLKPLKELALYLRHLGHGVSERNLVKAEAGVAPRLSFAKSDDEFGALVREAEALQARISDGLKNTQAWTAQMAHEMKTPLTILQNSLERGAIQEASAEVAHLNNLISGFLDWASAENFAGGEDIVEAVRIDPLIHELAAKLERQNPGRIIVEGKSDLIVFAKRSFVQQAVSNLLTNALKYSPVDSKVRITLQGTELTIEDRGAGLPEDILARLGHPFNHGSVANRGFGLGLAWVRTICQKYGWQLLFERRDSGGDRVTVATLRFPDEPPTTEI